MSTEKQPNFFTGLKGPSHRIGYTENGNIGKAYWEDYLPLYESILKIYFDLKFFQRHFKPLGT